MKGKPVTVRINGQVIPIAGSLRVLKGRDAERVAELELEHSGGVHVVDVDAALKITIHSARAVEAITCRECGLTFEPEQLADQVKAYLEGRYEGRRLGDELRDELAAAIAPWWDRFRAGADICFDCGVTPPSSS